MMSAERADSDQNGTSMLPMDLATLSLAQDEADDVHDQEQDGRRPDDAMEPHGAVEIAEHRLQRVRSDHGEQRDGHERDRPQDGDLRKAEPRPEIGRRARLHPGCGPQRRGREQCAGGQNPPRSQRLSVTRMCEGDRSA